MSLPSRDAPDAYAFRRDGGDRAAVHFRRAVRPWLARSPDTWKAADPSWRGSGGPGGPAPLPSRLPPPPSDPVEVSGELASRGTDCSLAGLP